MPLLRPRTALQERATHLRRACDERFEREPGQCFGAIYVNLGLSGLLTLTAYLITTTLFSLTMTQQRSILIPVAVLGPCLCFRLAKGL
ncbi:MAG: DUF983 domain-containing protein [bacterium]